jgi:hypothetical protein
MSASRPILTPFSVITNGNMAGNLTSAVTVIQNLSMISYSCSWVGTSPVGVISIQVSNDYSQNADGSVNNPGTWNTLPMSATGTVTGNTGTGYADVDSIAGYAVRVIYTATSGTGTLNVIATGKVQ